MQVRQELGASPSMGCRSKAGGAGAGEEQICLRIQALAITMPASFPELPSFMMLYDALGTDVRNTF